VGARFWATLTTRRAQFRALQFVVLHLVLQRHVARQLAAQQLVAQRSVVLQIILQRHVARQLTQQAGHIVAGNAVNESAGQIEQNAHDRAADLQV
jgi:hypothetical protein